MWGSASSPGSWHSPGPLFLAVVGGRRQGENPSSQVARAEADCSPLALCAYVRASVSLLVGRSDGGGEPGMRPFQNRIKYFEMRIVGLCFLSSRPLPVLPPCVWAEEPGGHPWHPYRAPLAKSPNPPCPVLLIRQREAPPACRPHSFLRKSQYRTRSSLSKGKCCSATGETGNCCRSTDGAYGKREKKDWERRVLADEFLGFSFAPFARCSPL